jgi:hypothetical protein
MYAKLPNNWGHYNPYRKLPTRAQGDTINPRPTGPRSKGSIDLASAIHRQVSMGQPKNRRSFVSETRGGHEYTKFYGRPISWMAPFMTQGMRVRKIIERSDSGPGRTLYERN